MKRLIDITLASLLFAGVAVAENLQIEDSTATTNSTTTYTFADDVPFNWYKLSSVQFEHGTAGAWDITVAIITGGDRTNNVFSGSATTNSVGAIWLLDGDLWVKVREDGTNTQIVTTSSGTNYTATIQLAK